jgi:hypothetical protein
VTKYDTIKEVGITDKLYDRKEIPKDYHCDCNLCRDNFLGEIFHTPTSQYYTQSTRSKYYFPDEKPEGGFDKHICPGHWSGYRYAIQKFTNPGDTILDPTVGTGTAVVEAINHGRNAIGIELEFSEITKRTIQVQYDRGTATGNGTILEGDARDLHELLHNKGFLGNEMFDMIINGTPYPVLGGGQSDAPERGYTSKGKGATIQYGKSKNVGVLKGQKYWDTITDIYISAIEKLKPGGKFITLIKDPTQNKEAYLLHKMIADRLLEHAPMKYYGTFIHRHLPQTLFMNTYPKRYPEVRLPLYQTGTILEKI